MGIVIINGKRYDSITGLAIDTAKTDTVKVNVSEPRNTTSGELPTWISEYVQERKEEKSEISEVAAPVRHAPTMRHHTSPSRTLDRRFIAPIQPTVNKKPSSITIEDAASDNIAVKHTAKAVTKPSDTAIWSIKPDTSEPDISPETDKLYEDSIARLSAILDSASELDNRSSRRTKRGKSKSKVNSKAKTEPKVKPARKFSPRAIFATTGAIAVVVALGVYIAMPSISVRMAAADAGIDARNPYAPKGYTIDGKIAASKGKVKISYRNTSGSDGYSITQEKSDLTDSGLHSEVISQTTDYDSYEQIKANGKNIYLNGNTATWVDGGIKYTVDGNDFLDTDEITNIANSL